MKFHCSFGYIRLLRAAATAVFTVLSLFCLALLGASRPSGAVMLGFLCPLYIVTLIKVIPAYVGSHFYSLDRNCLIVSSGVFLRRVRHIPCKAVIGINLRRSFFERIFSIMSLELSLGSGRIFMRGLSESDARKIFRYRR